MPENDKAKSSTSAAKSKVVEKKSSPVAKKVKAAKSTPVAKKATAAKSSPKVKKAAPTKSATTTKASKSKPISDKQSVSKTKATGKAVAKSTSKSSSATAKRASTKSKLASTAQAKTTLTKQHFDQPQQYYGTGRRKSSVARVFIREGSGNITINAKSHLVYFGQTTHWPSVAVEPLERLGCAKRFDCIITVQGGGISGQAGAVRLGLARALVDFEKSNPGQTQLPKDRPLPQEVIDRVLKGAQSQQDEEEGLSPLAQIADRQWQIALRKEGFLTRDYREVLRKLFGFRKHAKKEQFSKR